MLKDIKQFIELALPQLHKLNYPRPTRKHMLQAALVVGVSVGFFVWLAMATTRGAEGCAFKIPRDRAAVPEQRGRLNTCVKLERAQTESALVRGLSGRDSLPRNQGMLFVFAESGKQCMWMKDMNFDLDMLWLDEQRKVVHIERGLPPQSYPKSFCSPIPAKYVVEINSGIAEEAGIQKGQEIIF